MEPQAHDSESVGSPDVELLVSPLVDVGTDTVMDVSRPVSPVPTVENLFVQDRMWAPVVLPSPDVVDRRETPEPRWRLAREGPFLAERSPESIRSLGLDVPSGEFGLPVHYPRFLEWIGVPQSVCLLEMCTGRWVDHLSRDQVVAAAVQLERDVGLMQTNLDFLDQYSLALQGTASKLIELCLGARAFPAEEVATGALGVWVLVFNALPCRWRRWGCGSNVKNILSLYNIIFKFEISSRRLAKYFFYLVLL